jgi:hypothetical protein
VLTKVDEIKAKGLSSSPVFSKTRSSPIYLTVCSLNSMGRKILSIQMTGTTLMKTIKINVKKSIYDYSEDRKIMKEHFVWLFNGELLFCLNCPFMNDHQYFSVYEFGVIWKKNMRIYGRAL